ncbi:hypothetical protein [Photobacterium sp. 1_MG-2023]|uniref:hypothetical protein n=1 Tax=Photobacterium sp. 1_MG-2023 TaxID=3062646 RepID=UPI0026E1D5EF|nr:hypothetical protein [Photobacterium sp. 1_MG-2023]MDO6705374.1 hypothetical protein [Photobacterium sp. 1_MG-2023]
MILSLLFLPFANASAVSFQSSYPNCHTMIEQMPCCADLQMPSNKMPTGCPSDMQVHCSQLCQPSCQHPCSILTPTIALSATVSEFTLHPYQLRHWDEPVTSFLKPPILL